MAFNHIIPKVERRALPPPRVMAVDVDGTLVINGRLNTNLVEFLRVQRGAFGMSLMLWSMRGAEYARKTAEAAGVADMFDTICGKPGYIVDDKGWTWAKDTVCVQRIPS